MDILPKPKTVNLDKLKGLSDQELETRIKTSPEKINKKRERYNSTHALNMARLKAYQIYRDADADASRRLLAERKTKAALPTGNPQNRATA